MSSGELVPAMLGISSRLRVSYTELKDTTDFQRIFRSVRRIRQTSVFMIERPQDKRKWAAKIYHRSTESSDIWKKITSEILLLDNLQHPNVVHYEHMYVDDKKLYILSEWADVGDLQSYAKLQPGQVLSESQITPILYDLISALTYIHNSGLTHRNVMPKNVLLYTKPHLAVPQAKLGYFKCAVKSDQSKSDFRGPVEYTPPEVLQGKVFSPSGDIWSLGVLAYSMLTGRLPFRSSRAEDLETKIMKDPLEFPSKPRISRRMRRIILAMLHKRPKARGSVETYLSNKVFRTFIRDRVIFHRIRYTPQTLPSLDNDHKFIYFSVKGGRLMIAEYDLPYLPWKCLLELIAELIGETVHLSVLDGPLESDSCSWVEPNPHTLVQQSTQFVFVSRDVRLQALVEFIWYDPSPTLVCTSVGDIKFCNRAFMNLVHREQPFGGNLLEYFEGKTFGEFATTGDAWNVVKNLQLNVDKRTVVTMQYRFLRHVVSWREIFHVSLELETPSHSNGVSESISYAKNSTLNVVDSRPSVLTSSGLMLANVRSGSDLGDDLEVRKSSFSRPVDFKYYSSDVHRRRSGSRGIMERPQPNVFERRSSVPDAPIDEMVQFMARLNWKGDVLMADDYGRRALGESLCSQLPIAIARRFENWARGDSLRPIVLSALLSVRTGRCSPFYLELVLDLTESNGDFSDSSESSDEIVPGDEDSPRNYLDRYFVLRGRETQDDSESLSQFFRHCGFQLENSMILAMIPESKLLSCGGDFRIIYAASEMAAIETVQMQILPRIIRDIDWNYLTRTSMSNICGHMFCPWVRHRFSLLPNERVEFKVEIRIYQLMKGPYVLVSILQGVK